MWYFFITDRIKNGEVKVAYCPTNNMLADFFTKPLQGTTFMCMWEKDTKSTKQHKYGCAQECVGLSKL